jgi:hypothetical protein
LLGGLGGGDDPLRAVRLDPCVGHPRPQARRGPGFCSPARCGSAFALCGHSQVRRCVGFSSRAAGLVRRYRVPARGAAVVGLGSVREVAGRPVTFDFGFSCVVGCRRCGARVQTAGHDDQRRAGSLRCCVSGWLGGLASARSNCSPPRFLAPAWWPSRSVLPRRCCLMGGLCLRWAAVGLRRRRGGPVPGCGWTACHGRSGRPSRSGHLSWLASVCCWVGFVVVVVLLGGLFVLGVRRFVVSFWWGARVVWGVGVRFVS